MLDATLQELVPSGDALRRLRDQPLSAPDTFRFEPIYKQVSAAFEDYEHALKRLADRFDGTPTPDGGYQFSAEQSEAVRGELNALLQTKVSIQAERLNRAAIDSPMIRVSLADLNLLSWLFEPSADLTASSRNGDSAAASGAPASTGETAEPRAKRRRQQSRTRAARDVDAEIERAEK